jgi:predicted anti-sigma-YlaC factor YlaD
MRCRKVKRKLAALLDSEPTVKLPRRIEKHLESCSGCRDFPLRLSNLASLLSQAVDPPVPRHLPAGIIASAKSRATGKQQRAKRGLHPFPAWGTASVPVRLAAAASLLFGMLLGALMAMDILQSLSTDEAAPEIRTASDPGVVYKLDALKDAPEGSLTKAYLNLTATREQ